MNLIELCENIDSKIRLLVQKLDALQAENLALRHELAKTKQQLNKQTLISNKSEDTIKGLANRESQEMPDGIVDVKQQLDYYIHKLDRCIAWLEKE